MAEWNQTQDNTIKWDFTRQILELDCSLNITIGRYYHKYTQAHTHFLVAS